MPPPSRSQLTAYAVIAVLVLAVGGRWLVSHRAAAASGGARAPSFVPAGRGPSPEPAAVRVQSATTRTLVHVAGAVRRPGVYRMAAGGRVQDAIRCAGGATRHADLAAINLAAPVQDGVQIVVPAKGAAAAAGAQGAGAAPGAAAGPGGAQAAPVDLNTATAEQLDTLDGVGPATAAKILDYRRQHGGFRSVDDLTQIPGIGPKRLAALRGKVRI